MRVGGPVIALLATALLTAGPARAEHTETERLEWELLEAETALAQDEPRVAASHYRGALREAWYLLGLIAAVEGRQDAAHDALARARDAAAVDLRRVRLALALVELELGDPGDIEQPLRELRLLVREDIADAAVLRVFVTALRATGRAEELEAELEELRALDPEAAAALASPATSPARALPELDVGTLAGATSEELERSSARLRATLIRVYRNLAALAPHTGIAPGGEHDAAGLRATAAAIAARHPEAGEPHGRVDLTGEESFGDVHPPRLDPVALIATTPASLHPALALVDDGDLAAAEEALRRQLDGADGVGVSVDVSMARTLLGVLLAQRGRFDEAEETLRLAIETAAPGAAHQALARLYWSAGRHDEALHHLRAAAALGPLERDLALALAEVELATCGPFLVEPHLRALDKERGSVEALMLLVDIARCTGREKVAFEAVERAFERAPSCEDVLARHGELALELGIVSSAMRSIEPLVRMRPEVAAYRVLLGDAWRQRRDMGEAVEAYAQAVALDPDHLPALLPLALALNHERRFAAAQPHFERYLAAHPDDLDALAGLAEAEQRLGQAEAAERRVSAVLTQDPAHARANLVLGMARMGRGELAAARESFARAVAAEPTLAKAHYQLSLACGRLGDRACAAEHLARYQQALQGPEATYIQLQPAQSTVTMTKQENPDPP